MVLVVLFSFPKVQTWAAKKVTTAVNEKYKTDIKLKGIGIGYTGNIELKEVFIKDHHQDTLVNIGQFETSIVNFKDLTEGNGKLTDALLKNVHVKMQHYKEDDVDNFRIFLRKFLPKKKATTPFLLDTKTVKIKNGRYEYYSEKLKDKPIVFIKNINLEGNDLSINGTNISLQSNQLSFTYNDAINVTDLTTFMELSTGVMRFSNVRLQTDKKSDVKGDVVFRYQPGDMEDFNNLVKLKALVTKSKVSTTDLRYFYSEFGKNNFITVTTEFAGTLNDFKLNQLHLRGLKESIIVGNLHLYNSMSKNLIKDFKMSGNLKQLTSSKNDLSSLLPKVLGTRLPRQLDALGRVTIDGAIKVTPKSVDLNGGVKNKLGQANAVLFMDHLLTPTKSTYQGNLNVLDFDLGAYLNNKNFGKTSFNLDVNGKGFFLKNLDTSLEGTFSKLEYKGYSYSDIAVIGELKDPLFDGRIIANDPNLQLIFNGLVNINEVQNDYDFSANVNKIDFNALNLFKRDSLSFFSGNVVAKLKGTSVDDAFGTISFRNTYYKNQNDAYNFKDFKVTSSFNEENVRTITMNSPDIVQGKIEGIFKFKNIKQLFKNSLISLYNKKAVAFVKEPEFINFDFKIYNKIVDVFFPDVSLAPNTFIKGNVSSDVSEFKLDFKSPQIKALKNSVDQFNFEVDNSNPLYNAYITMDRINSKRYPITDFSLLNVTLNDTLYVRSAFKGGKKSKDEYDLNLFHTIDTDKKSVVGIQKSYLKLKGNTWNMNYNDDKSHLITFDHDFNEVKVDSIELVHKNERIDFSGVLRDSTYKDFKVRFSEVDLAKITPTIDSLSYKGIINGNLEILQKDGAYYPESNITVSDFIVNKIPLGELVMNVIGNEDLTKYVVNTSLKQENAFPLTLKGEIDVSAQQPQIDLDVDFKKFRLEPFSPLGGIVLSNLRGNVNGKAKITGNYLNPDINGSLFLKDGGLSFQYLNVDFSINQDARISLTKQRIIFNNTLLTDTEFGTKGYLNGAISHSNFKDWNLDLKLNSNRLLALNTNEADNDLYYGTAFIKGNATITGKTDKLLIAVEASSEPGTKFKIPISDAESVGDNSFIHFVTPDEKKARIQGEKVYFEDVKGLELQFDLDLNKNAEVEVVVDKQSGSTLKGSGAGTLLIEINTNGKFNMWGDFVAYQGTYDFKYGGLLSKRFDVQTGGSISWDGSPTAAKLNLSAIYKTNANPAILLENSFINRKIPVEVVTTLQGELLKPDLSFDIEFPQTSSIVKSELDYVLSDRVTKERQALSLVTQGSFYSDALIEGNSIVTDNLVEHASSLVSSIFSSDDDKLGFGFDYVTGDRTNPDQEISDRFGVSVTTQISNRILINGKVGVPIGGVNESVVVGDVRIDFLLNKDGTLRATIFNKQNDIQQLIGETEGYTQGVGLSYSYDFDTFKELLRKVFVNENKVKDSAVNFKK
ncbi:translocation/assembly module TamB domain-containing protein [Aquimarina agarivorans]|uniref:translocation/assembly module TamB domain-containing protein n=1 Tax=Aquimarina agarivorans TaxID=980584 RepID=UPI0002FA4048|nr:translocation/assembly module TamB domain-containing protein [Aquimarina agarivorans]